MTWSLNTWQMLGLALVSGMLWMHYVQSKDREQPEPRWRVLLAFGLGVVAWVIAILGYRALEALHVPEVEFNERPWTAV